MPRVLTTRHDLLINHLFHNPDQQHCPPNTSGIVVHIVHVRRQLLANTTCRCAVNLSFYLFIFFNCTLLADAGCFGTPSCQGPEGVRPSAESFKVEDHPVWLPQPYPTGWVLRALRPQLDIGNPLRERICVCVCLSVRVCVPQLLCRTRGGCWKSSWRPHRASRLLQFLTSLLSLSLQLVTKGISLSGFSFSEASEVTWSHRNVPFSGTQVPGETWSGFLLSLLACRRIQFQKQSDIVHHVSNWKKACKWTWPCVTGPLRCSSLCPVWPSANVRAYHIACSNLWKQILACTMWPVHSVEIAFMFWPRSVCGHRHICIHSILFQFSSPVLLIS